MPTDDGIGMIVKLGVERRQNARILYPPRTTVCRLPQISANNYFFKVHDVSLGGCCLLDPSGVLGSDAGQDVELTMHWSTGDELVLARLISRVHDRRHMQFLNLSEARRNRLKDYMSYGVRGLSVRPSTRVSSGHIKLAAAEMWSSLLGDGVVIERPDQAYAARIHFHNKQFLISREGWPRKLSLQETFSFPGKEFLIKHLVGMQKDQHSRGNSSSEPLAQRSELEQMTLFLINIPNPSLRINELAALMENQVLEGKP